METIALLASGIALGSLTGLLAWKPWYRASWKAAELTGTTDQMPRHRPGLKPLVILSAIAGALANVLSGSHFMAIPAAVGVAVFGALLELVPAYVIVALRARRRRIALKRELGKDQLRDAGR